MVANGQMKIGNMFETISASSCLILKHLLMNCLWLNRYTYTYLLSTYENAERVCFTSFL